MVKQSTEEKLISNKTKYKEELERLMQKYNGTLKPLDVVKEAKNSNSPLHSWFDWNDNEASQKWRLHQARMLINSIRVTVMFEGTEKQYRKYLNVNVTDEKGRSYVSTERALSNPDMKEQILKKAINEVEYWRRTYQDYTELEDTFKGINKTKKKLKKVLVNYN